MRALAAAFFFASRAPSRQRCRGVKKRKVKLTFKQKRRKLGKLLKSVAHGEVKESKTDKANRGRTRKTDLKSLW